MTASKQLKGLLAGAAAVALIGTAMAQGNPPNPAVKNPAVGAGQQSSQQTPMGTTGTPGGGAMATGSGSSTPMGTASTSGTANAPMPMNSGSSMGSSSSSADTTMASASQQPKRRVRMARADRN